MKNKNLEVDYLEGYKIFQDEEIARLERKYGSVLSIITKDETMGITVTINDLKNLNHALRQTLILFPNKKLIVTAGVLQEQYFNPDDNFVATYLYLTNYWTQNQELANPIFKKVFVSESA